MGGFGNAIGKAELFGRVGAVHNAGCPVDTAGFVLQLLQQVAVVDGSDECVDAVCQVRQQLPVGVGRRLRHDHRREVPGGEVAVCLLKVVRKGRVVSGAGVAGLRSGRIRTTHRTGDQPGPAVFHEHSQLSRFRVDGGCVDDGCRHGPEPTRCLLLCVSSVEEQHERQELAGGAQLCAVFVLNRTVSPFAQCGGHLLSFHCQDDDIVRAEIHLCGRAHYCWMCSQSFMRSADCQSGLFDSIGLASPRNQHVVDIGAP